MLGIAQLKYLYLLTKPSVREEVALWFDHSNLLLYTGNPSVTFDSTMKYEVQYFWEPMAAPIQGKLKKVTLIYGDSKDGNRKHSTLVTSQVLDAFAK